MADVDEHEAGGGDALYGIIIGLLYVIAVGVQVYLVVDEVTHGALSDDVKARYGRLHDRWRHARRIDAEVRCQTPWVLWEAHQALEETA